MPVACVALQRLTGKVLMDPAESDVTTYNVRVRGDTVEAEI